MDRYRLAVVVEDDDFEEPPCPVGSNVEITVALTEHANGVPDCVLDVLVGNTMFAGVVRDLNFRRLTCSSVLRKVTCDGDWAARRTIGYRSDTACQQATCKRRA